MGAMCGAYRTGRSRRSTATSYRSAAGLNWNRGWTTALMTRKVWSGKGSRLDLRWYSPKVTTTEDKTLFLTQWPAVTTCRRLTRTPPHLPLPTRIRACQGNDPKPAGSPSRTRLEKQSNISLLFLVFSSILYLLALGGRPHTGSLTTGPKSKGPWKAKKIISATDS